MKYFRIILLFEIILVGCNNPKDEPVTDGHNLFLRHDHNSGTISVFRNDDPSPVLIQHAKPGIRPYIHPIKPPDGKGVLTEFSPAHHKHQTGLYWGLKQVNGRDYFMNWLGDYWKMVSANIMEERGLKVKWGTVYDLLDDQGSTILTETQNWSMEEKNGKFLLDLEWKGEAKTAITLGKFYVGGLFLRMPWREGIPGEVMNAVGQKNADAEGQRAIWNDIGLQVDGRDDRAHIAILDHHDNKDFPIPWRVDNELGIGPSRQILGDWHIGKGETEVIRYRLIVYTGDFNRNTITQLWKEFVCQ